MGRHRVWLLLSTLLLAVLVSGCGLFSKPKAPVLLSEGKPYTILPGQGNAENTEWEYYNETYHDPDRTKLTDGTIGDWNYQSGAYAGFRWPRVDNVYTDRDVEIVVDLGAAYNIGLVRTHWTWDETANIRYPSPLVIALSTDGTTWSTAKEIAIPYPQESGSPRWFEITMGATGRYVKVSWVARDHWYHMSEIQVYESSE